MALWATDLARKASGQQVINDSKTPSGRAHVGALRGVLIHDAVHRALVLEGVPATYRFGSDDYDPLDEIPFGMDDLYRAHLGQPLCNVPPPPDSDASDLADYFISEFFGVFERLGVHADTYRMRDLYRSGRFDRHIDTVLRHQSDIVRIYREANNSIKPHDWHGLQVICEVCGRIGTTVVTAYDGDLVDYRCQPDLVSWAEGCGHRGRVSPFGGNAKLPWKLEWPSKWVEFGVTIEGAGKDHNEPGGSRVLADAVMRQVFHGEPPLNIRYEFFLFGGAKMSSSRGIGVSAADIADLLPPELLRFLLVRTPPKRALNFSPDLDTINALFVELDRLLDREESGRGDERDDVLLSLVSLDPDRPYRGSARVGRSLPWDTMVSLLQLPHVDFDAVTDERFDPPLTDDERRQLGERRQTAERWLAAYADPDQLLTISDELPAGVGALDGTQREYVHRLADALAAAEPWDPDAIQGALFDTVRAMEIDPPVGFSALYTVLLGRDSGPKAGNLLAFLDRDTVVARLRSVPTTAPS